VYFAVWFVQKNVAAAKKGVAGGSAVIMAGSSKRKVPKFRDQFVHWCPLARLLDGFDILKSSDTLLRLACLCVLSVVFVLLLPMRDKSWSRWAIVLNVFTIGLQSNALKQVKKQQRDEEL